MFYSIIGAFEGKISPKQQPQMKKEKVHFHQDNAPCLKSIATMVKLHELHF